MSIRTTVPVLEMVDDDPLPFRRQLTAKKTTLPQRISQ
jgi:hypothetical protein